MMKKFFAQAYVWILLIILYAPILIIAIYSFTEAKVLGNWTGFSFNLYRNVFSGGLNNSLVRAIENTLSIGLSTHHRPQLIILNNPGKKL